MEIKSSNDMAGKIFSELKNYNDKFEPKVNFEHKTFYIEDDGEFVAGLEGFFAWDVFDISNMISLRKREGLGRKLIAQAEEYAKEKGATKITAWTLDFQSPEFYKKCGFQRYAKLENFAGKSTCHYFVKYLKGQ